ncbi:hypothetical protein [Aurantiacibacter marinus]|uniref:hypothetical protein n=1 Tax=Aurantiacibacter marinus TaxID=874156 RepID=UPI00069BAE2E|nr:hypothetical protein [Aurantiacibacter marinus]
MFYLHGRIIEVQGLPAISERYGEYRFDAIQDRLAAEGFVVHAPVRPANSDVDAQARQLVLEINDLIDGGVPAQNITVIGASKGAYIASLVSHHAENPQLRFVLLAGCAPAVTDHMVQNGIGFSGAVLTIRDSLDTLLAGSCQDVFNASENATQMRELVVETGLEHGLIYGPRDEWILPALDWANAVSVR